MRGGLFFQLGTPSGLSQSPSLFTGKPPPAQALEESLGEGVTVVAAHWEVTVWIPPSLAARHRLQCSLDRGGGRGGRSALHTDEVSSRMHHLPLHEKSQ